VLAGGLSFFAARNALAVHFGGEDTRQGYERAVRWEPQSSRNWYLLGRSYLYDLEQPDAGRAVEALRKAVALDPYSAEALLDLANAYEGEGDTKQAQDAYLAAQKVYPMSADVAWSYGNYLLRQGQQDAAYAELHKSLTLDPSRATEAFSRAISASTDVNELLDKMVPATAKAYLPILHWLSDLGDMADAELVWYRLVGLNTKVPIRDEVPFFNGLLHAGRPGDAARLWPQAIAIMENPPPPDPESSVLWDGGFESGFKGGGFAWEYKPVTPDVQIGFDRAEKHSGEQSMRILFNGHRNLDFEDVCHQFVPEGKKYVLTAWVKTQLTSSEGVRLQIHAFSGGGMVSALSEDVHGTRDWTELRMVWTAPPDSGLGSVCIKRIMSDAPGSDIQGAAWIDDVVMVPATEAESGAATKP
jgi:hypothetical protein